ncbi:hypothetical protein [Bacillus pseudomycoides]|uniref:hypothetical protein n=1 Tax=Bacillus pseudomycoides TaxID=64104 RepID=UPI000BF1FBD9|nr:hypothetical protein [Bacillus pseudomycoides]PEK60775.1 hypothetical protein CN593_27845 [Bacillus pseudomycoides]PFY53601.1 hypothetical protein COL49_25940 [Bacillus pseudomycoides]PGE20454.1 hypothetical protein COM57_29495 [Bacillus pseudomycoides]
MKVQEVIERLNSGTALVNLAEEINVCENGLKNALEELEFIYDVLSGEWVFKGIISKCFDSSIFEFVPSKDIVIFSTEQLLTLKSLVNKQMNDQKTDKRRDELYNRITSMPDEDMYCTKILIKKSVGHRLDTFSNKLKLNESDILSLALSDFLDRYEIN